jgi:hypothetical protein
MEWADGKGVGQANPHQTHVFIPRTPVDVVQCSVSVVVVIYHACFNLKKINKNCDDNEDRSYSNDNDDDDHDDGDENNKHSQNNDDV